MRLGLLVIALGCTGGEQQTQQSPAAQSIHPVMDVVAQRPAAEPGATVMSASGSYRVDVLFEGVGALHKGFFVDAEAITELSENLSPCFDAATTVKVGYEAAKRRGWIIALMDKGNRLCQPTLQQNTLDLAPLTPIGRALAGYRDAIAANYDMRVASFQIGLLTLDGPRQCMFWNAGQHPPDGTLWDRCVMLGTQQVCASEKAATTPLHFLNAGDAERTARCFRD